MVLIAMPSWSGINILLILLVFSILLLILKYWKQQQITKKLYSIPVKDSPKERKEVSVFLWKTLKKRISLFFLFRKHKALAPYLYYGILLIETLLFAFCLVEKKLLFAIAFPLLFHWFVLKVLELLTLDIHYFIQRDLPIAIQHLVKVLTRTSDLKTAIYETSKSLNDPLRSMFLNLSRKMITENHEKSLMEMAEEANDIWLHAFVFLLISYKEQSKKEDIVKNLTMLADMITKENRLKEKAITDRKFITIMNYALAAIGLVGMVANIMANPYAPEFFFQTPTGMICFIIGISAILGTVLINLRMSRRTS